MKKKILIILLLGLATILRAQTVDNITTEQSGDFIRIGYQLPGSQAGQTFRVQVLCSINGGLNTEIKSVSGDIGDNIQGGKSEYFVLWDVLKDVDELTSAEFIIRAELMKDINIESVPFKNKLLTEKWSKKWIHLNPAIELPGQKPGMMFGIMGSFGASASLNYGNYSIDGDVPTAIGDITIDEFLDNKKVYSSSYFLTKRIVNYNAFQMHLMAGLGRTRLIFQNPGAAQNPFREEKLYGPAFGITADYKLASIHLHFNHFDPGSVEKEDDSEALSPLSYVSFALGVRF
jgi:hypothetical protein